MNNKIYVDMQQVIGSLAIDYNIPHMEYEDLITLGVYAVRVYNLEQFAKQIPFADLCEYITGFIKTPFGNKILKQLQNQ